MLCSESGSIDRDTNRMSHFNVVDQLTTTVQHSAPQPANDKRIPAFLIGSFKLQVVSVWARESGDDPEAEYEMEFSVKRPEDDKPQNPVQSTFRFSGSVHRLVINLEIAQRPQPVSGDFAFESRLRKKGSKTWLTQSYALPVDVVEIAADGGSQQASKASKSRRQRKKR
jgi:hypothetical protein